MMMIELKNIKHSEFASEETHCYEATLYVDGVRWGVVGNQGTGGPDHFHGVAGRNYGDLPALDERIAAAYPRITFGDDHEGISASLETVCGDLVNQFLRNRALTRMYGATKTKVLYFKEPPVDGSPLYEVAMKAHPLEAWLKHLAGKYPDAVVINTLPKQEALAMLAMAA
jgi:hypothetical protein